MKALQERPCDETLRQMCYVCDNHTNNQNTFRVAGGFEVVYKILTSASEAMQSLRHRALIVLSACCRSNLRNLDHLCASGGIEVVMSQFQLPHLQVSSAVCISLLCENHAPNQIRARAIIPFMLQALYKMGQITEDKVAL